MIKGAHNILVSGSKRQGKGAFVGRLIGARPDDKPVSILIPCDLYAHY